MNRWGLTNFQIPHFARDDARGFADLVRWDEMATFRQITWNHAGFLGAGVVECLGSDDAAVVWIASNFRELCSDVIARAICCPLDEE